MTLTIPSARVTGVTGVTASIHGACRGNLDQSAGVTEATLSCQSLANEEARGYSRFVVANSTIGRRGPAISRRTGADHTAGAFFVPAAPSYGGCAWETFGSAGFLESRSANLRTAATLIRFAANRGSSSTLGARPMKHTLNPPKRCRIAAHKAQAMAALRADSSLSVRLARYNAAMQKARSLEASGGAL